MKLKHMVVVAAVATVSTSALADAASLAAAKAAKDAAKAASIQKAKDDARIAAEKKAEENKRRAAAAAAAAAASTSEAARSESELHAKNTGIIERLDQIATHTKNADLAAKVATLRNKEDKRHQLAAR